MSTPTADEKRAFWEGFANALVSVLQSSDPKEIVVKDLFEDLREAEREMDKAAARRRFLDLHAQYIGRG